MHSYKPVFLLSFLKNMNETGSAKLEDAAKDFAAYYEDRKKKGLPPEKKSCIFTKGNYTEKDVEGLILRMPFKRFEDMHAIINYLKQFGKATKVQFRKLLMDKLPDSLSEAQKESKIGNLLSTLRMQGKIIVIGHEGKQAIWALVEEE